MKALQAKAVLEQRLAIDGHTLGSLDAPSAVEAMLSFYRDVRASDVTLEHDGDGLLYQWGVRNWGEGPSFEFDVTRQFAVDWEVDDDSLFQLSLTLHYDPAVGAALDKGHEWCFHPDDADTLQAFITDSAAFRTVADLQPLSATLTFGGAG